MRANGHRPVLEESRNRVAPEAASRIRISFFSLNRRVYYPATFPSQSQLIGGRR